MNYKNYTIRIEQDEDAGDPCQEFDMLGKMVFWHKRMNLGHCYQETNRLDPSEWLIRELQKIDYAPDEWLYDASLDLLLCAFAFHNVVIPVYAYEHGGITIKAYSKHAYWDQWDSGQLGFVYVSHDDIKKEYGDVTDETKKQAESCLLAEIQEYDAYLTGEVYGYIVEDEETGEHVDSCWGFYGEDGRKEAESQAKSFVDWKIQDDEKQSSLLDSACAI